MSQKKLSEKGYIIKKGRQLPFNEIYIRQDWKETGLAEIIVSKKQPGGNLLVGSYIVDTYCLGVKDCFAKFNLTQYEYEDLKEQIMRDIIFKRLKVNELHNIIYGAIDYAEELGFKPHKDFEVAQYLLDPELIDDGIDEIEFGKGGQPLFIQGPYDNPDIIMATLNKTVGEGNYLYIQSMHLDDMDFDDDYEDDDNDYENDDDEYDDYKEVDDGEDTK